MLVTVQRAEEIIDQFQRDGNLKRFVEKCMSEASRFGCISANCRYKFQEAILNELDRLFEEEDGDFIVYEGENLNGL